MAERLGVVRPGLFRLSLVEEHTGQMGMDCRTLLVRTFSVLGAGHSVYWEMSGFGCDFERESCLDWTLYTLQFLRTAFYSAGAFCCSYTGGRELSLIKSAFLATKPDVPELK